VYTLHSINIFNKSWLLVWETCAIMTKDIEVVGYGALTLLISLFMFAFIGLLYYYRSKCGNFDA